MWLLLSLFTASFESFKNVVAKKGTSKFNPLIVTWAWLTFSLPIFLPVLLIVGIPPLDRVFWIAFSIRIVLDMAALILYMNSLKLAPLSLSQPMLAFSPIIILISSYFINGELPSSTGIGAIILILLGSYLLNFDRQSKNLWSPFKALTQNRGALMMFGVAVIWGINSSIHKLAINHSNPWFYGGFGALALAILFTPLAYFSSPKQFMSIFTKAGLKTLVPIGLLDGMAILPQWVAFSMTYAAYVIAVKRLSILFSSILGWYIFKENIKNRLLPILLMVVGVLILALS